MPTTMKLKEVSEKIQFADELPANETVSLRLQRARQVERSESIVRYLQFQTQKRFFGSIIVAAIDTSEQGKTGFTWQPLEITPEALAQNPMLEMAKGMDESKFEKIGMLGLSSDVHFYALDGQHRLGAIKDIDRRENAGEYISNSERLAILNDEVSVLFIQQDLPYDADGKLEFAKRYKSLFSNLNRYAKPTNQATNILMDQSDGFALLTIRMLEEFSLFKYNNEPIDGAGHFSKIRLFSGKNVTENDPYFTSLITLYTCTINLLNSEWRKVNGWKHTKILNNEGKEEYRQISLPQQLKISDIEKPPYAEWSHQDPDADVLDEYFDELSMIWGAIFELFPELSDPSNWMEMRHNKKRDDGIVSHPLLRPAILEEATIRFRKRIDESFGITKEHNPALTKDKIVEALSPYRTRLKWDLFEYPFKNLVIKSTNKEIIPDFTIEDYFNEKVEMTVSHTHKIKPLFQLIEWIVGNNECDDAEIESMKVRWTTEWINHKYGEQAYGNWSEERDKDWKTMTDMII